jgi:hypothetical protein
MTNHEQAVRDAAIELKTAITEAVGAGYRIAWPSNPAGLDAIAVSETRRVGEPARVAPGEEYDGMHKTALVELANARGISIPSNATKAEVIAALKAPPESAI